MDILGEVLNTLFSEPIFLICLLVILVGLGLYFLEWILGIKKLKKRIEDLEQP